MDPARIDDLKKRLAAIRQLAEDLNGQTGDFPALAKNNRRLLASLRLMELNLGLVENCGQPAGGAQ